MNARIVGRTGNDVVVPITSLGSDRSESPGSAIAVAPATAELVPGPWPGYLMPAYRPVQLLRTHVIPAVPELLAAVPDLLAALLVLGPPLLVLVLVVYGQAVSR